MSLDKAQRTEIRRILETKLQAVEGDIASYKELNRPVSPDPAIGRLTRMEAIQSKSINESALREAVTRASTRRRWVAGSGR